MLVGGPIVIEELLKANRLASPGPLPWHMSAADLDLDAQLGCRGNISIYAYVLEGTHYEENETYRGWASPQVRLFSFCNSLS